MQAEADPHPSLSFHVTQTRPKCLAPRSPLVNVRSTQRRARVKAGRRCQACAYSRLPVLPPTCPTHPQWQESVHGTTRLAARPLGLTSGEAPEPSRLGDKPPVVGTSWEPPSWKPGQPVVGELDLTCFLPPSFLGFPHFPFPASPDFGIFSEESGGPPIPRRVLTCKANP